VPASIWIPPASEPAIKPENSVDALFMTSPRLRQPARVPLPASVLMPVASVTA
jgi:hypothetical protein